MAVRERLALAAAVAGPVAAAAYAVQRVIDAAGEPPLALLQAHIPYYWRAGLAAAWGLAAGLIAGFLARDEEEAARWLARAPWLALLVPLAAAILAWKP